MTGPPLPASERLPHGGFAALLLGVMLFIVYGSYVPFEWRSRPWDEVVSSYRWAVIHRVIPDSRSDWAANVALGIPLGFAAGGWIRANRRGPVGDVMAAITVAIGCTAFAAAVEFGQLYSLNRTCSGSDIWAQGLGAAVGAGGWVLGGRWLSAKVWHLLSTHVLRSTATPLLPLYCGIVALVQFLPLDLTASPRETYRRVIDPAHVTLVPCSELATRPDREQAEFWKHVGSWIETFALFVPAGLLAAELPKGFGMRNEWFTVAGCGLLGAAVTEFGQVLVVSRHASSTDALIGGLGVLTGWTVARLLAQHPVGSHRHWIALGLGSLCVTGLAISHWQPFDFRPQMFTSRLEAIDWMPLGSQVSKNYLWALNEIVLKFLVYTPLGALVVWELNECPSAKRSLLAAGVCGLVAVLLELGQSMVPARAVSPSDLVFGVVGGYLGGEVTRRLSGARVESTSSTVTVSRHSEIVHPTAVSSRG